MKKISIVTPVLNEEENLPVYYETLTNIMNSLSSYEYELLLIDNCSTDNSREYIKKLCKKDTHVKTIFNIQNYGYNSSVYHGLINSDGDCTILINCDLQDPPELIYDFIKEWESGYKVVLGIKKGSKENPIMVLKRKIYYKVVDLLSDKKQVLFNTGFGLYDKQFIETIRGLNESAPYIKELVSSFSFKTKRIDYIQESRKRGKGQTKFYILYDDAMTGLTLSSKRMMRLATFGGGIMGIISLILAITNTIIKLLHPDMFADGIAFIATGVFLLSSIQLFFIGILGEYVLSINIKANRRNAVYEEERINF